MKFLKFIISLYLLSNVCPLLTKYGTEILTDNDVIFESKDFDDDEEMHFKIQSKSNNFNYYSLSSYDVEYYYFSNADSSSIGVPIMYISKKPQMKMVVTKQNILLLGKQGVNIEIQMEIIFIYNFQI